MKDWSAFYEPTNNGRANATYLGIKMARIRTASNRSIQTFVLVDRTLVASTKLPKTAEKNIIAMPTVGSGLALNMPYGSSRAKVGRKASIVVSLRPR